MDRKITYPYLIIGAGPSGLAAAHKLGSRSGILEKEERPGGICRSYNLGEGVYDLGGHSFHTPHPEIHAWVNSVVDGGLYGQRRDARCHSHGVLIPYPFQKHFSELPDAAVVRECAEGLTLRGDVSEAADFEEHIVLSFGPGIASHFMLPYNRKIWARDLKRISTEWVSQRIAAPGGKSQFFRTEGGERTPLQDNTKVYYPSRGGFDEIVKGIAREVRHIHYGVEVCGISPKEKMVLLTDGRRMHYHALISTMPLPLLAKMVKGLPKQILSGIRKLECMSLKIVFLLIGARNGSPIQRIYCAEDWMPAHKIAFNHNSSEHLKSKKSEAIICEVSYSDEKKVDDSSLVDDMVSGLMEMGAIGSMGDVDDYQIHDLKYAYPVYTRDRAEIVSSVKGWLQTYDIYTLGRFGEWLYINSDEAIARGLSLAEQLIARRT